MSKIISTTLALNGKVLAGLLFVLLFASCGDDVKYYRKINYNVNGEYAGGYPINKLAVPTLNCYKIVYRGGELRTIEFLKNGKLHFADEGFCKIDVATS